MNLTTLKTHLIYILIIIILCGGLIISINKCSSTSGEYKHNIEALHDTIKYYKDANGNLVATKLAFESDVKTLKILNKNLYDQIDSLKLNPNTVTQIIQVGGDIEIPERDSSFNIHHDTISKGFSKKFDFNDKYRILEGNVNYHNDSLGIYITKDIIHFDYTVAMDNDSKIYIKSTNPYVKYNEISGFQVPKDKKKHWHIGPAVSLGYDPFNKNASFNIGVSLNYSLISF